MSQCLPSDWSDGQGSLILVGIAEVTGCEDRIRIRMEVEVCEQVLSHLYV